ncbi:MAG: hypothetical protein QXE84_02070 [Candidatus Nitrosotenuis sp.]|uniref:Antitoxin SocA-like Panacea domain-containing protein n=1 Tax=Candidatus Nitrosotenuis uzonensis TaxID=1407055 RepID=A0A812EXW2_9ARCH|nr:hypothetical protein [Candidatus Nitrosotenuis uzonensis]CAE6500813.1 conserved hypothetical protein [Candidatus Nitrosotenuis uzonensis]
MDQTIENLGLVGLILESGHNNTIIGRKRIQKMVYFAGNLGWNVGKFDLHLYGPYSRHLASTLHIGKESGIFDEKECEGPYEYQLTTKGQRFMTKFKADICNKTKLRKTKSLLNELSSWDTKDLEIAATIDFVNKSENLNETNLLALVGEIKDGFTKQQIKNSYDRWLSLKPLVPISANSQ